MEELIEPAVWRANVEDHWLHTRSLRVTRVQTERLTLTRSAQVIWLKSLEVDFMPQSTLSISRLALAYSASTKTRA
jgi:hypothetical protein